MKTHKAIIIDNHLDRGKSLKNSVEKAVRSLKILTVCKHGSEGDIAGRFHAPDLLFIDLSYDHQFEQIRTWYAGKACVFYSTDKSIVNSLSEHGFHAFSFPVKYSEMKYQIKSCLSFQSKVDLSNNVAIDEKLNSAGQR